MTESSWTELITAIHANEHQAVLAVTGGGSRAISQLLQVPGASRTVLEAVVPYSAAALADWLGSAADQACSAPTARAMAMASWIRARALSPKSDPHQLVGVGATASLVSDRPKRGEHRVHVAIQTATTTATYSLVLAKDDRVRLAEETLAAQLLLLGLAKSCQLDVADTRSIFEKDLQGNEQIKSSLQQANAEWTELLLGERSQVCYPASHHAQSVFPGAFNPPHVGHKRIAAIAAERLGCPVSYELSITNVDKPPLDFFEIDTRLKQLRDFDGQTPILLSDAPTFPAKAALFPGCTFVVGADTIARIANPKYYRGEATGFAAAIQQIADGGCRFLVFGRQLQGKFCVLSDIELPQALLDLCDEVSAADFREDISSSEVRSATSLSES